MQQPGIQTTIFLIVVTALAALAAWMLTRGHLLFGKKPSTPAPPPSAPTPDAEMPPAVPLTVAAPPPYPGASAQSIPLPPAAMPIPPPTPARPPTVKVEEYHVLEGRLREVEALLGRLALQGQMPALAPVTADVPPSEPIAPQQMRGEVYRLADEEMPTGTIARRLSLSRSEVELLLELRRLRGAVTEPSGM